MELCGGELADLSSLELLKRKDIQFEVVGEYDDDDDDDDEDDDDGQYDDDSIEIEIGLDIDDGDEDDDDDDDDDYGYLQWTISIHEPTQSETDTLYNIEGWIVKSILVNPQLSPSMLQIEEIMIQL